MKRTIIIRSLIILLPVATILSCKTIDHKNEYFPEPVSKGGWRAIVPPNTTPTEAQKEDVLAKTGLDWDVLKKAWDYDMDTVGTEDEWPRDSRKSLLVIRHGWIAFEQYYSDNGNYNKDSRVRFASGTKTLVGVGFAKLFTEGRCSDSDYVYQYMPESWAESESARKKIRIRHILSMSSGLEPFDGPYDSATYSRIIRNLGVIAQPGTQWFYNTGALDLLNYVIFNRTGQTLEHFLNSEVMNPIGGGGVSVQPRHTFDGFGFCSFYAITPRDYARIGYLFLKQGRWRDRQIIDREVVTRVTTRPPWLATALVGNSSGNIEEPNKNYAYTFWLNKTGGPIPALPSDAFMASGGNHKMIVIPSLDMIVVRYGNYVHDRGEVNPMYGIIRQAVTDSHTVVPRPSTERSAPQPKPPAAASFTSVENFKTIPSGSHLEIEAEDGVCVEPMRVNEDMGALAVKYAWMPDGISAQYEVPGGPGSIALAFHVPESGIFSIWIRTIAPGPHSDSYFLCLDGKVIDSPWNIQAVPQSEVWQWNRIRHDWPLNEGNHVLEFRHRESGIKLDKIIITSDPNFRLK